MNLPRAQNSIWINFFLNGVSSHIRIVVNFCYVKQSCKVNEIIRKLYGKNLLTQQGFVVGLDTFVYHSDGGWWGFITKYVGAIAVSEGFMLEVIFQQLNLSRSGYTVTKVRHFLKVADSPACTSPTLSFLRVCGTNCNTTNYTQTL